MTLPKPGQKSHGYAYVDALPRQIEEVSNVAATRSDFFSCNIESSVSSGPKNNLGKCGSLIRYVVFGFVNLGCRGKLVNKMVKQTNVTTI